MWGRGGIGCRRGGGGRVGSSENAEKKGCGGGGRGR